MRVALFGHTGYVGKVLMHLLITSGNDVVGFSRSKSGVNNEVVIDITSDSFVDDISEGKFDCIVIASAKLPTSNYDSNYFEELLKVNVIGTRNAILWALRNGVNKVVYLSSLSVIDDSAFDLEEVNEKCVIYNKSRHYPYSISKLGGEQVVKAECEKFGINHNILRISSIYGKTKEQEGVIKNFISQAKSGEVISINSKYLNADFIHINDVVKSIYSCINKGGHNGIINIASGESTSLKTLALIIRDLVKSESKIITNSNERYPKKLYSNTLMKSYLKIDNMIRLREGLSDLI